MPGKVKKIDSNDENKGWDGSGVQYSQQCMADRVEHFKKFKMADGSHLEGICTIKIIIQSRITLEL